MEEGDVNKAIADKVTAALQAGITDEALVSLKKHVEKLLWPIEDYIQFKIKEELAPQLADFVAEMAENTVDAILRGNEQEMRRYLNCNQYGASRSTDQSAFFNCKIEEQHPIIHGQVHLHRCIELRKQIVEAHRDLIANERILDLEDIVKSLTAQVNEANRKRDAMWERLRAAGGSDD